MPQIVTSRFTAVQFAEEELKQATTFPELNRLYLCAERTLLALQKLELKYTPNDPLTFAQQEAYMRGQLELLDKLIGD